jgi:hypothetical protein
MSNDGAAPRAAVPMSSVRAEASRRNGAKSRGPNTPAGKTRSSQNALKHGLRAARHVVLPNEDGAEFAALEAAMIEELAPVGALQTALARRVAIAAWRLARADRLEVELFAERSYSNAGPGLALIRDGNGTRSFETLLRYRSAAMAEFWRALRTLKALQAEQAAEPAIETAPALAERLPAMNPKIPAARPPLVRRPRPNGPGLAAEPRMAYVVPELPVAACALHEPAAPWRPSEPEPGRKRETFPAPSLPQEPAPARSNEPESRAGCAGLGRAAGGRLP